MVLNTLVLRNIAITLPLDLTEGKWSRYSSATIYSSRLQNRRIFSIFVPMGVRAKKALGQHFLTDQSIAKNIVGALEGHQALEVGPGMGVLTQYLLPRPELALKVIEIDGESVVYLKKHFPKLGDSLIEGDFLKMDLDGIFEGEYSVIGNFPYNISSQIFFKILEHRDRVPEVVCMIQKEVAERIAEKPGTKTYGILSVFLQAWYDIEYLFTVGSGAFNPPPKVQSAVIRLSRNSRTASAVTKSFSARWSRQPSASAARRYATPSSR